MLLVQYLIFGQINLESRNVYNIINVLVHEQQPATEETASADKRNNRYLPAAEHEEPELGQLRTPEIKKQL